jgi:hypothetical protein
MNCRSQGNAEDMARLPTISFSCIFLSFALWSLVLVHWVLLRRGRVYYQIECIGKLSAEAFLRDPRLIDYSRDTPNAYRCM